MLQALRKKQESEEGFTLIELMVVVLIIAILIAIAIPTFLGAQNRARDRAAQSDLRNALSAAKTIATDFEGYWKTDATCAGNLLNAAKLYEAEKSLSFVDTTLEASPSTKIAVVVDSTCENLFMTRRSTSKKATFGILAKQTGEVTYCKTDSETPPAQNTCTLTKW